MEKYIVGGFVRDKLLGLDPKDKDWVVVGETPESMLSAGFKQVGSDFPVFLHPETGEEYALARTERKNGKGYKGFETFFDSSVTLEDDLIRRDLTINAMALDDNGNIIDPFDSKADLNRKLLKHVSAAFAEDPLRVLRVGRFASRFEFTVEPNTLNLMKHLVQSGEVKELSKERIWCEIEKVLSYNNPIPFFTIMKECGGIDHILPPQFVIPFDIDFSMLDNEVEKFAALFRWYSIETLTKSLTIPSRFIRLHKIVKNICGFCEDHTYVRNPQTLMSLYTHNNAWGNRVLFGEAVSILERIGLEFDRRGNPKGKEWIEIISGAFNTGITPSFKNLTSIQKNNLRGSNITKAINDIRKKRIEKFLFNE